MGDVEWKLVKDGMWEAIRQDGAKLAVCQYGEHHFDWDVRRNGKRNYGQSSTYENAIYTAESVDLHEVVHTENMRQHATGAKRSKDADGTRFDLIPQVALRKIAEVVCKGGKNYGDHNWRKGFAWSDTMQHVLNHLNLFMMGDRSEPHLAHAATNLMFLIEFQQIHPELNDLLKAEDYEPPKSE